MDIQVPSGTEVSQPGGCTFGSAVHFLVILKVEVVVTAASSKLFPTGTSFVAGRERTSLPLLCSSRTWGLSLNRVTVSARESPILYSLPSTLSVMLLVISVTDTLKGAPKGIVYSQLPLWGRVTVSFTGTVIVFPSASYPSRLVPSTLKV